MFSLYLAFFPEGMNRFGRRRRKPNPPILKLAALCHLILTHPWVQLHPYEKIFWRPMVQMDRRVVCEVVMQGLMLEAHSSRVIKSVI